MQRLGLDLHHRTDRAGKIRDTNTNDLFVTLSALVDAHPNSMLTYW